MALGLANMIDSLRLTVQDWNMAEWIKYSLPDGLYSAAYILIIDAIWWKENSIVKFIIISLIPVVTICSELLQYYGLVKGTFDMYDLACYLFPPMIYLFYIYILSKSNKSKKQSL